MFYMKKKYKFFLYKTLCLSRNFNGQPKIMYEVNVLTSTKGNRYGW